MTLTDVYNIIEKENIETLNYKWSNASARIFEIQKRYYIALDQNKLNNNLEEKELLAEELGHYYCNALYYINSNSILKDKYEYRAKKWAYNVLVPINKLKEKITNGICNIYELAEDFEVNVEYMYNCIYFYKEKGLLT